MVLTIISYPFGLLLATDIRCSVNHMSYVKSIHNSIVIVTMFLEIEQIISSLENSSAGWDEMQTFFCQKMWV